MTDSSTLAPVSFSLNMEAKDFLDWLNDRCPSLGLVPGRPVRRVRRHLELEVFGFERRPIAYGEPGLPVTQLASEGDGVSDRNDAADGNAAPLETPEASHAVSVFNLQLLRLGSTRIRVVANCLNNTFQSAFTGLLDAITDDCPMAEPIVDAHRSLLHTASDECRGPKESYNPTEELPASAPWEIIQNQRDREMVKMWWQGKTKPEIASHFGSQLQTKTLENRFSDLRRIYGTGVVPKKEDLRKLGKSG